MFDGVHPLSNSTWSWCHLLADGKVGHSCKESWISFVVISDTEQGIFSTDSKVYACNDLTSAECPLSKGDSLVVTNAGLL